MHINIKNLGCGDSSHNPNLSIDRVFIVTVSSCDYVLYNHTVKLDPINGDCPHSPNLSDRVFIVVISSRDYVLYNHTVELVPVDFITKVFK